MAPPLVGRSGEVAALRARLDDAAKGSLQGAILEGDAGAGKTRLLDAALDEARGRGFTVLGGTAEELAQDRPLSPFLDALEGRDRLSSSARARLGSFLARSEPGWEPAEARFQALEELVSLVEQAARAAPLALALDDLQWADSLTLLAVLTIWRQLPDHPIVLLGAARPTPRTRELARVLERLESGGAAHLHLAPLDEDAISAIVAHELGAAPGPGLIEALRGAGGNPLFALELARALRDEGTLVEDGGRMDTGPVSLPPSMRLTILRRLIPLAEEALHALRVASALGSTFTVSDLATVLGRSPVDLLAALDEPLRAGLLDEVGDRLSFRHEVIREAVYLDLPSSARAALHLGAARRLAAAGARANVVATHFAAGADPGDSEAVEWLLKAGTQTMATDPAGSVTLLRRALEIAAPDDPRVPSATVLLILALGWSGRLAEAERLARDHPATRAEEGSAAIIRLALGRAFLVHGRLVDAIAELTAAAPVLAGEPRAELLSGTALAHALAGDPAGAIEAAGTAQDEAERAGADNALARAHMARALAVTLRGAVHEGAELAAEAAEETMHAQGRARFSTLTLAGLCLERADRLEEAEQMFGPVLPEAERAGGPSESAAIHAILGLLRFGLGRWEDAEADIESAAAVTDDLGVPLFAGSLWPYAVRVRIDVCRGNLDAAESLVEQVEPVEGGPALGLDAWLWAGAMLEEARGDASAALALLRRAWDLDRSRGLVSELRPLAPDLARLAIRAGDGALAEEVASTMEEAAGLVGTHGAHGTALRCRGLVRGDPAMLRRAVEECRRVPRPLDLAHALEDAGGALTRAGEREEAASLLGEASGILEGLGASRESARVEAALRGIGVRRGPRARRRRARSGWESLTPTEVRIARLAAEGLTNREIAERLYVSPRTVGTHVSHVLTKLGLRSRVALAAEVARRPEPTDGRGEEAPRGRGR